MNQPSYQRNPGSLRSSGASADTRASAGILELRSIEIPPLLQSESDAIEFSEARHLARTKRGFVSSSAYAFERLSEMVLSLANREAGVDGASINRVPANIDADYSIRFPSAALSGGTALRDKMANSTVSALQESLSNLGLSSVQRTGVFVNITLDRIALTRSVLSEVDSLADRYGEIDSHRDQRVFVDYSSPNIGKSLHVGHTGTTLIGQVMCNIYDRCGYTVLGMNYIGDWGTPVGKLKVAIEQAGGQLPEGLSNRELVAWISEAYAKISKAIETDESLASRAREAFQKLETGDHEMRVFWQTIREVSIKGLDELYRSAGVKFGAYIGESFYEPLLAGVLADAKRMGLTSNDPNGAVVVDLSPSTLPTFLLAKSDGASTYICRDLAGLRVREALFGANKSVYVVGVEQELHFRQVFETARRLGYLDDKQQAVHLVVGLITNRGQKVSSRDGGVLSFEQYLGSLDEAARSAVRKELASDLSDQERAEIASKVALGAAYFSSASRTPSSNLEFQPERMVSVSGKNAAYLQYACVRANSILSKLGQPAKDAGEIDWAAPGLVDASVFQLVRTIAELPTVMRACCESNSPSALAQHGYDLAQSFHSFARDHIVRDAIGERREAYLHIIRSVSQVLKNVLSTLNIEVPQRM